MWIPCLLLLASSSRRGLVYPEPPVRLCPAGWTGQCAVAGLSWVFLLGEWHTQDCLLLSNFLLGPCWHVGINFSIILQKTVQLHSNSSNAMFFLFMIQSVFLCKNGHEAVDKRLEIRLPLHHKKITHTSYKSEILNRFSISSYAIHTVKSV